MSCWRFRLDGWPLCPHCYHDELACLDVGALVALDRARPAPRERGRALLLLGVEMWCANCRRRCTPPPPPARVDEDQVTL